MSHRKRSGLDLVLALVVDTFPGVVVSLPVFMSSHVLPGADYLALPREPNPWLIEPVLPVGGAMLIYAAEKLGKSYLALQLGLSVATGVSWLGFPVRKTGRVVYVQLDTPAGLWAATDGFYLRSLVEHGFPVEALHYADRETLDCWPFDINNPVHYQRLREVVIDVDPVLVIIDTLREAHRGDENKSDDMQRAISSLVAATHPAALLLVHHSKKPNAEQGPDTRNDMRGGYIGGRMDTVFRLTKKSAYYFGRTLEDESIKIHREASGLWTPVYDPIEDIVKAAIASAPPNTSVRQMARNLAESTGRTENACRALIRRYMMT